MSPLPRQTPGVHHLPERLSNRTHHHALKTTEAALAGRSRRT